MLLSAALAWPPPPAGCRATTTPGGDVNRIANAASQVVRGYGQLYGQWYGGTGSGTGSGTGVRAVVRGYGQWYGHDWPYRDDHRRLDKQVGVDQREETCRPNVHTKNTRLQALIRLSSMHCTVTCTARVFIGEE